MAFVRMLSKLLRDKELGELVVPIVPDEARTFGMEALFRQVGIYSHVGQLYEPVDIDNAALLQGSDRRADPRGRHHRGRVDVASFIAAGTAYATHGVNMIPFFIYYSMFGFQRIGDLIWAAGDMRCRGVHARRHGRAHDARRRGPAAPGRPQPPAGAARPQPARLRPGLRLRDRRDHRRRHQADVRGRRERLLLPHRHERAVRACRPCPRGPARAFSRACTGCRRPAIRSRSSRRNSSAAEPSCPRSSRRRPCSPRSTTSRPTSGASPATPSCIATATPAIAGTCCTRPSRPACRG